MKWCIFNGGHGSHCWFIATGQHPSPIPYAHVVINDSQTLRAPGV